jgi:hypothetical protein
VRHSSRAECASLDDHRTAFITANSWGIDLSDQRSSRDIPDRSATIVAVECEEMSSVAIEGE